MANTFLNNIKNYGNNTQPVAISLFDNSLTNSKFGQIYLFSQFGQASTSSINFNSQITTHYTEDNYSFNDHWALEPVKYTITGLIGEVIYRPSRTWSNKAKDVFIDYLAPLGIIAPTFDSYTQSAINITNAVEESFRRYEEIAKQTLRTFGISQNTQETNQEFVIKKLREAREARQLVKIYTPYGTYDNMAIVSINANQENSKYQSTLEIQLQEWRTTTSKTRNATEDEKALLAKAQSAIEQQKGVIGTKEKKLSSVFYTVGADGIKNFFNGGQ